MAAVSLAIIGKNNEPLYMREFFHNDNIHSSVADACLIPTEEELFGITAKQQQQQQQDKQENTEDNDTATLTAATTTTSSSSSSSSRTCSLQQQFLLHAALDRFEELCGPPPGFAWRRRNNSNTTTSSPTTATTTTASTAADAMFVGLLCPLEEFRVYGYMTTTRIKFLLTIREDVPIILHSNNDNNVTTTTTMDEYLERIVKGLFVELHSIYVETYALNPFSALLLSSSGPITSQRFDEQIKQRVQAYNTRNIIISSSSSSSWQQHQ